MSLGPSTPLNEAQALATELLGYLLPCCDRAEIAGSIRREKDIVHDIEILAQAPTLQQRGLFGHSEDTGRTEIDRLIEGDSLKTISGHDWVIGDKNGPKYKQLIHTGRRIKADLYIIRDPRAWGSNLIVRTGPAAFSRNLMMRAAEVNKQFSDGFLLHDHRGGCSDGPECRKIIDLNSEKDVFDALDMDWLYPWERE